jgi:hypothetical protein
MENFRLGFPNAAVNCLMMGGADTDGEAVTIDAAAERGAGDRLTVTTAVLAVLTSAI